MCVRVHRHTQTHKWAQVKEEEKEGKEEGMSSKPRGKPLGIHSWQLCAKPRRVAAHSVMDSLLPVATQLLPLQNSSLSFFLSWLLIPLCLIIYNKTLATLTYYFFSERCFIPPSLHCTEMTPNATSSLIILNVHIINSHWSSTVCKIRCLAPISLINL